MENAPSTALPIEFKTLGQLCDEYTIERIKTDKLNKSHQTMFELWAAICRRCYGTVPFNLLEIIDELYTCNKEIWLLIDLAMAGEHCGRDVQIANNRRREIVREIDQFAGGTHPLDEKAYQ